MRTRLHDHPGYWFTAAGEGYRLHRHDRFVGWFATFTDMTSAAADGR
jgi:hypothetical protein